MDVDPEILLAFLQESAENLDQIDTDLVALESRPTDPDLLAQIFRAFHTIKGTSAFLGLSRLETVTHAGETLLGALRDGEVELTSETTTLLLQLVDAVRQILVAVESDGSEGSQTYRSLADSLKQCAVGTKSETKVSLPPAPAKPWLPKQADKPAQPAEPALGIGAVDAAVRISIEDLDHLMDLSSELVVVRGQLGELTDADEDNPLARAYQQLARITAELQSEVMRSRLQPIGAVVGKVPRIARDLADSVGKQVRIQIEGDGIGVDRAVNEALRDPLIHLVRNAIDHGLETPDERVMAGKPPFGTLRIQCSQSHGRVIIEISDDGAGIQLQRVRSAVVAKGLVTAAESIELTDEQLLELLFLPGVSTSNEVTRLSGRGVGMDVVRTSLRQIGGSIELSSEQGAGTIARISIPLTLAIVPSLTVASAGSHYAIPQVNVEEILSIQPGEIAPAADDIEGAMIYRLRDHLLPSVRLAAVLGLASPDEAADRYLVVLVSEGRRFALAVSDVGDTADVVAKPLTRETRSIPVFMGVTIRGDGTPALILDVAGIANVSGLHAHLAPDSVAEPAETVDLARTSMVLASVSDGGRIAVPLTQVLRLELLGLSHVERIGGGKVVQYREGILPLIVVSEALPERRQIARGKSDRIAESLATVVVNTAAGAVGLVVDTIDDIVAAHHIDRQPPSRRGVLECIVIGQRVVEVLDIETLVGDAAIGSGEVNRTAISAGESGEER